MTAAGPQAGLFDVEGGPFRVDVWIPTTGGWLPKDRLGGRWTSPSSEEACRMAVDWIVAVEVIDPFARVVDVASGRVILQSHGPRLT